METLTPEITPIPTEFVREGKFQHKLVWRDGPYAIYEYYYINHSKPKPTLRYEAVIIRIKDPHYLSKDQNLKESLPANGDWGMYGWSFVTFEAAKNHLAKVKETRGESIEKAYYSKKGLL